MSRYYGTVILTLKREFDQRENHLILQVGTQLTWHLLHHEVIDRWHQEQFIACVALPMGVPLGEAAIGHRSHHRLDDGDDCILARCSQQELDHTAIACLYLEIGAVQLKQFTLPNQIVGDGYSLPAIIIVHHIKAVGAGEQGEYVSWLGREQVGNRACSTCQWQQCHRQDNDTQ